MALSALLLDVAGLEALAEAALGHWQATEIEITRPVDGAVLGNGNLVLLEGTAHDQSGGRVERVEIAFDDDETWTAAQLADESGQWSYLWEDPTPGPHHLRVRVVGPELSSGVEASVDVVVQETASGPFVLTNPYATPGTFRKGQLHVHSTSSFDGWQSLPPAQLALEYRRRGYQFVAITDHDVVSKATEVDDSSFITIPALESTAESGHITGLFVEHAVSPELPPQQRLDTIAADHGLAVLNHPTYSVGWKSEDFKRLRGFFAFELYNGITSASVGAERTVKLWHEVLNAAGRPNRVWAVAVDDAHSKDRIDRGWVMVKSARLSKRAIRQSLEQGAFYASNGPSFGVLGVLDGAIVARSPDAATIRVIDQTGRVVKDGSGAGVSYKPGGDEMWLRVEAVAANGQRAWSQPFWLQPQGTPTASYSRTTMVPTLVAF